MTGEFKQTDTPTTYHYTKGNEQMSTAELTQHDAAQVAHTADNSGLADLYRDEMGFGASIGGPSFDRVKVPAGGGIVWEIPGANPDEPETTKEIVGVIVDDHFVSALWLDEYSGGSQPPDASWFEVAPNQIVASLSDRAREAGAVENINEDPFNAWGSGKAGRGKAANQMYRLYVLRDGDVLPFVVTVPPASITNWTKFKRFVLTNRKKLVPEVVVKLTLKRVESGGGVPYSQIQFSYVEDLPSELAAAALTQRDELRPLTRKIPVAADDNATAARSTVGPVEVATDDIPF